MATAYVPMPSAAPPVIRMKAKAPQPNNFGFHEALAAALQHEREANKGPTPERRRIAYLLCELGLRLKGRNGRGTSLAALPLSREDLARMLGTTLVRVKRSLGLLMLSGVVRSDGRSIEVVNWRKLCALADYDVARIDPSAAEDELTAEVEADGDTNRLTIAGEPACFV